MDADFSMFQGAIPTMGRTEEGVVARFHDKQVKTGDVTELGMPIYKDVLYVCIRIKDNNDVYDQPARKEDINRFPIEYNRYLNGKKQLENGTPLNQFAFLGLAQIETCNAHNIYTVEALAKLDGDNAKALELLAEAELARNFLEVSKNNVAIMDFAKKEKKYKAEIKKLKDEIAELKAQKDD